jgi:hypothetical protein
MKTPLFFAFLLLCLTFSCTKSSENIPPKIETPGKVFVPVTLFGAPWGWGGAVCSFGYIMIREDSNTIVYQSMVLPPYAPLPTIPVSVNIQYHDTVWATPGCYRKIVVDSIRY